MEENFHILLYRAFHAQRNALRAHMRSLGLGAGQPKLVAYLAEHGPCRQRELAAYFALDPAAVSRMVASLERGGFVTLSADPANRRCSLVRATERGLEAARAWRARCAQADGLALRGFTPQEQACFCAYLDRMRRNYEQSEGEDEGEGL